MNYPIPLFYKINFPKKFLLYLALRVDYVFIWADGFDITLGSSRPPSLTHMDLQSAKKGQGVWVVASPESDQH